MRKIKNLILIVFILFFALPLNALAIGQAIKPILIENALKGEEYEDILTLYNSFDYEETFNLIAKGEIAEWAKFYSLDNSEISIEDIKVQANSKIKSKVKFFIPADTQNGIYKGEIIVSLSPKNEDSEKNISTLITQQVPRKVSITITGEQILSCNAFVFPQNYKLNINEPLKTNVSCYNQGNVTIKPSIQQKIIKDEKIIFNAIFPYPENKEGIKPGYSETIPIEWQTTGQEKGKYQAEIKVLINDKIMKEQNFNFTIGDVVDGVVAGAEDSRTDKLFGFLSSIGGSNPVKGWFIIGGTFLIIAQVLIIINRRKKREKKI